MDDLTALSIPELQGLYGKRAVSPVEVVRAYLDNAGKKDTSVRAFLHLSADDALARARELEGGNPDGRPLFGVPVAVKDNICMRGHPTTCASKILEGYRPPYNATVVDRLIDAGAVIIGKTNLDEFAMGSSTENSAFHITRNPWNLEYAPGGSSGGSAAAVAAGMVPVALGSDTGGSIRQPASFCGVVGIKGSYGRISRYGLVAFASSLDQIGPIARDVRDSAITMQVLSGHDARDATSLPGSAPELVAGLDDGLDGLRIGIPAAMAEWEMDPSIREVMNRTLGELRAEGVVIEEVDLPGMETAIACYYVIANAEASSNLARYDGVRYGYRSPSDSLADMYEQTRGDGFGEEVKRRILLGTYVLSAGYYDAYYAKAQQVKAMIFEYFGRIFERVDLVLLPTSPTPAFKLGERIDDPIAMYLSDIFTTPANIAGMPAISVPAGLSPGGLPIGMQLRAGAGREQTLVRGAMGLERMYGFRMNHRCGC
ncbi:MAG: Asp-tRNA(Asn)/Glu-tRNA(Gln) amidotransferase subunit GatA [bacterium]|nr:MAG: Asp-tRNA(Asn)/Glu-tRNA(Gln) amidotransferase subunit GatA [bacterium]